MVDRGRVLLALVMGAGKTVVSIVAIEQLHELGDCERCLVVAPTGLKYQWAREIKKFSDAKATVIDGTPIQREKLWRTSIGSRYVIANAESMLHDLKLLGQFDVLIIDELGGFKDRTAKRARMMRKVGKTIPLRFGLTGQPIENRPEELFSIMEVIDKDVLGTFEEFDTTFIVRNAYGRPKRYRNLDLMMRSMADCMVRKTRDDIADQLPAITRITIPVRFDPKTAAVYRRIVADLLKQLKLAMSKGGKQFNLWTHYNGGDDNEAQGQIMARMTVLRMLCCNPELVRASAADYANPNTTTGSQYAHAIVKAGWMDGVTAAPKMQACLEFMEEVLEEDPKNKLVLFSFFKENLRQLQLKSAPLAKSVLFTGDMNSKQKDVAKEQFQTEPDVRLFLSSDAGGYGVDLPQANTLASFDLPWSSGKLAQREARIDRLSSEFKTINVVTFIVEGSIEEYQQSVLESKLRANEGFVDGKHHDQESGMDVDVTTLTEFLRTSTV